MDIRLSHLVKYNNFIHMVNELNILNKLSKKFRDNFRNK